jgi:hypothetical protein
VSAGVDDAYRPEHRGENTQRVSDQFVAGRGYGVQQKQGEQPGRRDGYAGEF